MVYNHFSRSITVFHGRTAPEKGILVGYGAIINKLALKVPLPDKLALISEKRRRYTTEEWDVFTPKHKPKDTLYGHLIFSLKYEGVNLSVFRSLFSAIESNVITDIILSEPNGQYSRRIWFLYEWLMETSLDIPDLRIGNYVNLLNEKLQYAGSVEISKRNRIRNNLPGTKDFCPLIRKTPKLEEFIAKDLSQKATKLLNTTHRDLLKRASAFLLLKDSKASYAIEGEQPPQNRAQRWGEAIGQAGNKPLSKDELLRLQQIVIGNSRFIKMGWCKEGGFVGQHDRTTGAPIPDHISARWEDIDTLVTGLIKTNNKLQESDFDPVLAASLIAFGFVFIHPFVDGNGRIHRYLIHHVIARMNFAQQGIVFPVSSAILERIDEYRKVLESYSIPRLDLIEWEPTTSNNVKVLNQTIDLYRYFDATKHAEFLYDCVEQTIEEIIPEEVKFLYKYDEMKLYLDDHFEMPDKMVALLIRFLGQNNGKFSKRAKMKEFELLSEGEINDIEEMYKQLFLD